MFFVVNLKLIIIENKVIMLIIIKILVNGKKIELYYLLELEFLWKINKVYNIIVIEIGKDIILYYYPENLWLIEAEWKR